MQENLIFDFGLHQGDDAAYYLHLGHRVVGVEANPLLADHCRQRFASEIRCGRMTVVNAGVLRGPGTFPFYRNLRDSGWSSFDAARGCSNGEWERLDVPCVTTAALIADYGRPYFLKVDIEGCDLQALDSIAPDLAPAYVSVELNPKDPIVDKLIDLGYRSFKFVDGESYWSSPPIFEHQVAWRALRRLGTLSPAFHRTMRRLPARLRPKAEWNPPSKHSPDGYAFTSYSSGPFGERAHGSWLTQTQARRWFTKLKNDYRRAGRDRFMWWDVHARHSSMTE